MKLIVEKLSEVISKESSKSTANKSNENLEQLLTEMKKTGLLKKPIYDLPLVDTIGKTYYTSINKRH